MYLTWLAILLTTSLVRGQSGKCDQTPTIATTSSPMEDKGMYHLDIENSGSYDGQEGKKFYTPDQTYVLTITSALPEHPFKWFMITAEDPDVDNNIHDFGNKKLDIGSLKTLDTDKNSRYSEKCFSSVESTDNSEKNRIEIHWVSPKQSSRDQVVRIRATVAENNEVWYEGNNLTIILYKDNKRARDSPPLDPIEYCNLCSEARYEVIFNGQWSRLAHPLHYPSKPDENGYTHMVGASHASDYTLWEPGSNASEGLAELAGNKNITAIERDIINKMEVRSGTRTLIRGKRRHHPMMSEPSHSLFRVDRFHHMFSILVGIKPSPDWFLGTSKFELCTKDGWYEESSIPLFPWDAGTKDGVSYESETSLTTPADKVGRVEVGSFDRRSPFYQLNLNDLKPFAMLTVRRLDVYPLINTDCDEDNTDPNEDANATEEQPS